MPLRAVPGVLAGQLDCPRRSRVTNYGVFVGAGPIVAVAVIVAVASGHARIVPRPDASRPLTRASRAVGSCF